MHLLVTRPEPDASEMSAQLEELGHRATVEPMLRLEFLPIGAGAFESAQALIATSRNGLRALASFKALGTARALPIFVVGPGTAELAAAMGFPRVIAGSGGARDLVGRIASEVDPAGGRLVHVAGEALAFDLAPALAERGIAVDRLTAYRMVAAESFTPSTSLQLRDEALEGVILMSPRTARVFAELLGSAGLGRQASRLTCFCLSQEVADALEGVSPGRVEIAPEPNSAGIFAAVSRVASHPRGV